ncbi:hypothetical protein Scep_029715 [Stephania cephalantha]|uniref:Uncharacterized protein n=1 Tax=Stephania cephalantha TaxID=152367 RepID=A0AAP0E5W9_9MAGN
MIDYDQLEEMAMLEINRQNGMPKEINQQETERRNIFKYIGDIDDDLIRALFEPGNEANVQTLGIIDPQLGTRANDEANQAQGMETNVRENTREGEQPQREETSIVERVAQINHQIL